MEPGATVESKFVEVHLFLRIEIHNHSFNQIKIPKDIYFGKGSGMDIFYRIEKYVDARETFAKHFIGSELPAFRELNENDFTYILPGEVYKLSQLAYYWIPKDQVHRIQLEANFRFNDPIIRGLKSNWLIIEKTVINHPITVINKHLRE